MSSNGHHLLAVSCGGGRNTAMLLGMYERGIKPDVITFANTGRTDLSHGEKPETYGFIHTISRWCEEKFGVPVTWVRSRSRYQSLYDNCYEKGTLPSAAYGLRSCSDKWKIRAQEQFMVQYPPALKVWSTCECGHRHWDHRKRKDGYFCPGSDDLFRPLKITKAIGYDAGETRRAKIDESEGYKFWYPLIEWGWGLEDCISAYSRHGLPVPRKSACYFCPSSKKQEVVWLYENHPDLYWSAVALEDRAREAGELVSVKGLGRHWTWRDLIQIAPQQRDRLIEAPEMQCACFDGDDDD